MSSLEALEELKDEIIPDYALEYEDDEGYKDWVVELYNIIKQDLEAYAQLKQDHDITLINNGELVVKVADLQEENNELKEKAQKYDELCKHNVMESQSFGDDLIQGILALNKRVIERNKKFIKIIEILKKYLFLADEKSLVWQKGYEHSTNVSDDDYELLNEVLKDE